MSLTLQSATVLVGCFLNLAACHVASAQVLTAREFQEQQSQWGTWIAEDRKLQITGRYQGALGRHFQMQKLDVRFIPDRGAELPERMQEAQRLTVSGRLEKQGDRFQFRVSRLQVADTDRQQLAEQVAAVPKSNPERWYELADEYATIAEFYDDSGLLSDVAQLRRRAVMAQRQLFAGQPDQLVKLADRAAELNQAPRLVAALRWEALQAQTQQTEFDRTAVLEQVRDQLPGWDDLNLTMTPQLEQSFAEAPVTAYDRATDDERRVLHRRFYRQLRLPEFQQRLQPDGSNGLTLAQELRQELPEESAAAQEFETAYVDQRLQQVQQLTRAQLTDLQQLLQQQQRSADFARAIGEWLDTQRDRFENRGLSGILRTADEYLFAFEQWQNPEHRDQAVELLKQAWQLSKQSEPEEADRIAQRLERYGWTRLHDRWMTGQQVQALPRSDIELAMRQGRVVQGMSPDQVIRTLGEPGRRVQVVSARYVQEIWVFGDSSGTSGISVLMKRLSSQDPNEARVASVTQAGGRP